MKLSMNPQFCVWSNTNRDRFKLSTCQPPTSPFMDCFTATVTGKRELANIGLVKVNKKIDGKTTAVWKGIK